MAEIIHTFKWTQNTIRHVVSGGTKRPSEEETQVSNVVQQFEKKFAFAQEMTHRTRAQRVINATPTKMTKRKRALLAEGPRGYCCFGARKCEFIKRVYIQRRLHLSGQATKAYDNHSAPSSHASIALPVETTSGTRCPLQSCEEHSHLLLDRMFAPLSLPDSAACATER